MKENMFTVDLGSIKLTDDQRAHINAAIQTAVSSELAKIGGRGHIAFVPVNHLPIGPIIQGIIARPISDKILQEINSVG